MTGWARSSTGVEGTGLGLALSRRLMDAMGGTIGGDSVAGRGSTFWIELPLVDAPERLPALLAPEVAEEGAPDAQQARTLLLIDDNLANLRLVERILEARTYITILAALQGSIGLELAAQHRPDSDFLGSPAARPARARRCCAACRPMPRWQGSR